MSSVPLPTLSATLAAIVTGQKQSQIDMLTSWNYSRRTNSLSLPSARSEHSCFAMRPWLVFDIT